MNLKGCYSHNSDDWATPEDIYNHFVKELRCIDPCPLHSKVNTLTNIFLGSKLYINPPYSRIDSWITFIENNLNMNKLYGYACPIFLLIPSRTDTKYFHKLMHLSCSIELYFIKGRLKFGNSKNSAPFPSVLIKLYNGNIGIKKTKFIDRDEVLLLNI